MRAIAVVVIWLALVGIVVAQDTPEPSTATPPPRSAPAVTWGAHVDVVSKYVWRGFPYSRGTVVWPSAWLSSRGVAVSLFAKLERGDDPTLNEYDISVLQADDRGRATDEFRRRNPALTLAVCVAHVRGRQGESTTTLPPIERHQVGPVVVGADAQKIDEAFPDERRELVDLRYEGMPSPALLLRFVGTSQRDGVVAELVPNRSNEPTVWRIQVRDPAFKTLKGIGVGSTVGQLRAAYRLGSFLSGEGTVAIPVEELSASFELDQSGPAGDQLWNLRTSDAVPDAVRIKSVLLAK